MINIAENPVILFTSPNERYHFARWGRPIAPVVFGVGDENLPHLKDAIAMTVGISGGMLVDTDPELGANFMWFFCRDWDEMRVIPDLDKLIPNFVNLITELQEKNATRYRSFGFEKNGAIQLCVVLIRVDAATERMSLQTLGTSETFQSLLTFGENAFDTHSPIATIKVNNLCIVKPEYAAVVRAAYDPALPAASNDPAHALRVSARAMKLLADIEDGA
ncbi:MAG: hypothetical protein CML33_02920 [Rhodobacteraceae bacterium]|nr:hypothetical protein [Paracoccaceae bacterium]|tara:strand:- start:137 stop:793 length:657 start_codon:yes stop_codon:yes gene_type:complete